MTPIVEIKNLSKTYSSGHRALREINLEIDRGEIFALLGPNGAGKTTLISIICGIVTSTSGSVTVAGNDIVKNYRQARALIGLVPQELATDAFEAVLATVRFSRGLFGRKPDEKYIEKVLRDLSLWEKRNSKIVTLSGGMKRRLLIAKALSHEPSVLFLDEPTAGVDVELRRDMWNMVRALRDTGVTIILTTHYIEEAEEMADRVGIINKGELILVREKADLMRQLGKKELVLHLEQPLLQLPPSLADMGLRIENGGTEMVYAYDHRAAKSDIATLLRLLAEEGVVFRDLATRESSLEDIFVDLVSERHES